MVAQRSLTMYVSRSAVPYVATFLLLLLKTGVILQLHEYRQVNKSLRLAHTCTKGYELEYETLLKCCKWQLLMCASFTE